MNSCDVPDGLSKLEHEIPHHGDDRANRAMGASADLQGPLHQVPRHRAKRFVVDRVYCQRGRELSLLARVSRGRSQFRELCGPQNNQSRSACEAEGNKKNPSSIAFVRSHIEHDLRAHEGKFAVIAVPSIINVFYRRDGGYAIERIDLDAAVREISGIRERAKLVG